MSGNRNEGFVKVGSDIINLEQIAHVKWTDERRTELHVDTVSGHTIKLKAEAGQALYKYLEDLPTSISALATVESALPVKLTQSLSGTTGMPHTQGMWPNDVRWDQFRAAYFVDGSLGPYSTDSDERRVLFRKFTFQANEEGKELFGSAYTIEERLAHSASFHWEEHGYLLRLQPRSYIMEPALNLVTPQLGFMVIGPGVGADDHFLLSVYTKNESGELCLVPHGEIKIYVDWP